MAAKRHFQDFLLGTIKNINGAEGWGEGGCSWWSLFNFLQQNLGTPSKDLQNPDVPLLWLAKSGYHPYICTLIVFKHPYVLWPYLSYFSLFLIISICQNLGTSPQKIGEIWLFLSNEGWNLGIPHLKKKPPSPVMFSEWSLINLLILITTLAPC